MEMVAAAALDSAAAAQEEVGGAATNPVVGRVQAVLVAGMEEVEMEALAKAVEVEVLVG